MPTKIFGAFLAGRVELVTQLQTLSEDFGYNSRRLGKKLREMGKEGAR